MTTTGSPRRGHKLEPLEGVSLEPEHVGTLVGWVTAAVVDRSGKPRQKIADQVHMAPSNFSNQLRRPTGPSMELLRRLQHALQQGPPTNPLWLTSFAEEHREPHSERTDVTMPAAWFAELVKAGPPRTTVEVFARGEALLSLLEFSIDEQAERFDFTALFGGEGDTDRPSGVELRKAAESTVRALLDITGGPPNRAQRANQILAKLGPFIIENRAGAPSLLREHIWGSCVGFRAVRVVGRMLQLYSPDRLEELRKQGDLDALTLRQLEWKADTIRPQIAALLKDIWQKDPQPPDPYRARSFFVEALRFAPKSTADNGAWDWVIEALTSRAEAQDRPHRERMYALYVLFEKYDAFGDMSKEELTDLVSLFRKENLERLKRQERPEEGLDYAANVVEAMMDGKHSNSWPPGTELDIVEDATKIYMGGTLPHSITSGMQTLVKEAALQIDGTRRRTACEAIRTAGLADHAVTALREALEDPRSPRWLQEHVAFIIGYLQASKGIEPLLLLAERGLEPHQSGGVLPSVRHAALWGIGDIAGSGVDVSDAAPNPDQLLARVVDVIERSVDREQPERVRWSATYAAAQILFRLAADDDPVNDHSTTMANRLRMLLEDLLHDHTQCSRNDRDDKFEEQDRYLVVGIAKWGLEMESVRRKLLELNTPADTPEFPSSLTLPPVVRDQG